jgi:hypothetical protein
LTTEKWKLKFAQILANVIYLSKERNMKKLFLVLALAMMFISCDDPKPPEVRAGSKEVVRIEGCQYLKMWTYGFGIYVYTHVGSCDNLIHPENWTAEKWQSLIGEKADKTQILKEDFDEFMRNKYNW